MRKCVIVLLALLLVLPVSTPLHADAYHAKPKIVVILVVDQLRADLIDRHRDLFTTPNGFNLFLKKGSYFNSCYYDYANTKTAPGHTTIATGAYTNGHGIGSNEWWDLSRNTSRVISSVEDERYRLVGTFDDLPLLPPPAPKPTDPRIGSSPRNEQATTIGDEVRLATAGKSKLYGISLKDRAAILPAGQTANAAYWIDNNTGRFVTSTYYMKELPAWVTAFNKGPRIAQAIKESGLEDTTQFYNLVGRTPAANSYELDFARALIENEKLGQNGVTDVLTISLSANDILGHQLGPDADTQRDMLVSLDHDFNNFFTWLDQQVGLANVMVAFTADHGIAPITTQSAHLGVASARLDLEDLVKKLDEALNAKFSPTKPLHYFMPTQELPYIALDPRVFAKLKISEQDAEDAVAQAVPAAVRSLGAPETPPLDANTIEGNLKFNESRVDADPTVSFIRTRLDIAANKLPDTSFGRLVANSYTDHGGWYVMVVIGPYQMEYTTGTTHFSPWSYDRHVPLGFFGSDFIPGYYRDQVAPVDIAPTFAAILGVNAPSASVGRVLTQVLRPAPAATDAK